MIMIFYLLYKRKKKTYFWIWENSKGVEIPEEIIADRMKKFAINRQMLERYYIYHKGVNRS